MPDNMNKVGVIAEVASAAAAIVYPVCKIIVRCVERRRLRAALRQSAFAAAVEARLVERCAGLEARLARLERKAA